MANGNSALKSLKNILKLGIKESRVVRIIEEFNGKDQSVDSLVDAFFLRDEVKESYKQTYKGKLTRLKIMFSETNLA